MTLVDDQRVHTCDREPWEVAPEDYAAFYRELTNRKDDPLCVESQVRCCANVVRASRMRSGEQLEDSAAGHISASGHNGSCEEDPRSVRRDCFREENDCLCGRGLLLGMLQETTNQVAMAEVLRLSTLMEHGRMNLKK